VTLPHAPGSAVALRARFGEMMDCWLEVHCSACKSETLLPIKMQASRYGKDVQIGAILGRLSCKRCSIKDRKVRPGEVWLIDRPGRRDIWDLEGWAVQLIGEAVRDSSRNQDAARPRV
jgi:hypothetical protein